MWNIHAWNTLGWQIDSPFELLGGARDDLTNGWFPIHDMWKDGYDLYVRQFVRFMFLSYLGYGNLSEIAMFGQW